MHHRCVTSDRTAHWHLSLYAGGSSRSYARPLCYFLPDTRHPNPLPQGEMEHWRLKNPIYPTFFSRFKMESATSSPEADAWTNPRVIPKPSHAPNMFLTWL